jgi:hypothetical protein
VAISSGDFSFSRLVMDFADPCRLERQVNEFRG